MLLAAGTLLPALAAAAPAGIPAVTVQGASGGQTYTLSLQVLANNVLNTVQFASIDTVVNSPTFGQVTGVRPMRRISVLTRLRF